MNIKVKLSQGPVNMRWLKGRGLNAEYHLWNEIYGHEFFPENAESANYVLTLRKEVSHHSDVSKIEGDIKSALTLLSEAWVFSGGSLFPLTERKIIDKPLYSSNSQEVEKELLSREGKTKVSSSLTTSWESGCTYYDAPLRNAISICTAAIARPEIQKIVKYYAEARLNSEKWFIDLYKVRDSLKAVYGSDKAATEALNIDKNDWRNFGMILNSNDLRHPPKSGVAVSSISRHDKNMLEELAREWILNFLKYEGAL